jgi:hypothetical protein
MAFPRQVLSWYLADGAGYISAGYASLKERFVRDVGARTMFENLWTQRLASAEATCWGLRSRTADSAEKRAYIAEAVGRRARSTPRAQVSEQSIGGGTGERSRHCVGDQLGAGIDA